MIDFGELLPLSVLHPCPRCGVERTYHRGHRRATCGNPACVSWCKSQGMKGVSSKYEKPMPAAIAATRDPRRCGCGAKLSFLVDMYGQVSEHCDVCHHHADFGRHPIKDAA